jgi:hypothetical protein
VAYTWGRPTPKLRKAPEEDPLTAYLRGRLLPRRALYANSMPPVRWALACSLSRSGSPSGGLAHLEDAPLSLSCYSYLCDIRTANMGRGREARPIEERGTLCEGRGRASGATGYRRERRTRGGRFSRFRANVLYRALVGKERKKEEQQP